MIIKIIWLLSYPFLKILNILGVKRLYQIGKYRIYLDFTHKLPIYQKQYPYYDKFLPLLVKNLPKNSLVIDIGANVGDTLAAMVSANNKLRYFCIEADRHFFILLKKNIDLINRQEKKLNIKALEYLVGKNIKSVSLKGNSSTKTIVKEGTINSQPLSKILKDENIPPKFISLIKTDVDGYDYDVIRSTFDSLENKPYIFFECQYDYKSQLSQFKKLFKELQKLGYYNFVFFDNYGQFITTLKDLKTIYELLNYVANQNFSLSTRSIYYYDILACTDQKLLELKKILQSY